MVGLVTILLLLRLIPFFRQVMEPMDAFDKRFPTDDACKEYLVAKRRPNGARRPRCGAGEKVYAL